MRPGQKTTTDRFTNRIFFIAVSCQLLLVTLYWIDVTTAQRYQLLHSLFDLDSEGNIPAWFSSTQLSLVALTMWSCALRRGRLHPSKLFYALAGFAALYVSSDETAQIHERITALVGQRYVDWLPRFAAHHFLLVMIAVAVFLAVCQLLASDLVNLWTDHRRATLLLALGVGIGLTGGMGIETLGYKLLAGNTQSLWYKLEVSVEEFMEMFGASLLLLGSLKLRLCRKLPGREVLITNKVKLDNYAL